MLRFSIFHASRTKTKKSSCWLILISELHINVIQNRFCVYLENCVIGNTENKLKRVRKTAYMELIGHILSTPSIKVTAYNSGLVSCKFNKLSKCCVYGKCQGNSIDYLTWSDVLGTVYIFKKFGTTHRLYWFFEFRSVFNLILAICKGIAVSGGF